MSRKRMAMMMICLLGISPGVAWADLWKCIDRKKCETIYVQELPIGIETQHVGCMKISGEGPYGKPASWATTLEGSTNVYHFEWDVCEHMAIEFMQQKQKEQMASSASMPPIVTPSPAYLIAPQTQASASNPQVAPPPQIFMPFHDTNRPTADSTAGISAVDLIGALLGVVAVIAAYMGFWKKLFPELAAKVEVTAVPVWVRVVHAVIALHFALVVMRKAQLGGLEILVYGSVVVGLSQIAIALIYKKVTSKVPRRLILCLMPIMYFAVYMGSYGLVTIQ